ncbi:MAG: ABC transporter permease [Alkaliphilus sp.]
MNFKHIWIVFKKELLDLRRDKKTWIASVLIPILMIPLMFFLMGVGIGRMDEVIEQATPVTLEANEEADVVKFLKEHPGLEVVELQDARKSLIEGEIRAIIVIAENFQDAIESQFTANIKVLYDEVSNDSSMSAGKVQRIIDEYSEIVRLERLTALGISPDILQPTLITREAYIPEGAEAQGAEVMFMLSFMLPMFLLMYTVTGGMPVAIDLGSGEKERMSLEPLLSTNANRLSILTGKYLTILLAAAVGVVTSLLGLAIAGKVADRVMPLEMDLSLLQIGLIILVTFLVAMIVSAIMLSLSIFARSHKEAGTYIGPLVIIIMLPNYIVMFADIRTISTEWFFVPVLNSILLIKEVLSGIFNPLHIFITVAVSLVLVTASIFGAKYVFNKESIIFRS